MMGMNTSGSASATLRPYDDNASTYSKWPTISTGVVPFLGIQFFSFMAKALLSGEAIQGEHIY